MLRITEQTVEANVRKYFIEALTLDDYLKQGSEEPGLWYGRGAALLGLTGRVRQEEFSRLLENRHPTKDERLTPRTKGHRRVGYDFTFLAPKSVAVVAEVTKDPDLFDAHNRAVDRTLDRIEQDMQTRVRMNGQNEDRVTGNMVFAKFVHHTARPVDGEPDMLLHTHAFAINATRDPDELRWKAGQFGKIKAYGEYYAAVYHAELAKRVVAAGYKIRATKHAFEIQDVPEPIIQSFSRRTELIESIAQELGVESGYGKANLGAKTRERKREDISLSELRERWRGRLSESELDNIVTLKHRHRAEMKAEQERPGPESKPEPGPDRQPGRDAGCDGPDTSGRRTASGDTAEQTGKTLHEEAERLRREGPRDQDHGIFERPGFFERMRRSTSLVSLSANAGVNAAVDDLFSMDAVVNEVRILRRAQHLTMGKATMAQLEDALRKRTDLVGRKLDGKLFFTTATALREEERIVSLSKRGRHTCGPLGKVRFSRSYNAIDERNRRVVDKLMDSRDTVTLFRQAGPTRNREVTRAALTGLQQGGRIPVVVASTPEAARNAEADYALKEVLTVRELLWRAKDERLLNSIVRDKVLWVEDAGRLGTRTAAELLELANKAGCRVVFAGDETRCRIRERGDAFRLLREEAGLFTVERRVALEVQQDRDRVREALREDSGPEAVRVLEETKTLDHKTEGHEVVRSAAEFFVKRDQAKKRALVVTPDQGRVEEYSQAVRQLRREKGSLKGKDRTRLRLNPVYMTDKDARKASSYERGMVIEFHRATRGFRPGDRAKVVATAGGQVLVQSRYRVTTPVFLRISRPHNFSVYKPRTIKVAKGERIRITQNGIDPFGKKIRKGMTATVKAVCRVSGRMELDNGITLTKRFGHFEHDYAQSTGRLGGRRAEHVVFAARDNDWGWCDRVDLTAAEDAAKGDFKIIIEDGAHLRTVLEHEHPHHTATDLAKRPDIIRARELAAAQLAEERMRMAREQSWGRGHV